MKYVRRPVQPIEATQYVNTKAPPVGVQPHPIDGQSCVVTQNGLTYVHPTDWIITNIDGTYSVIPDKAFQSNYEVAREQ